MKRTIILLVVTLAVAAWVYWMEVREQTRLPGTEKKEQAAKTLVGVTEPREILAFTLKPADGEAITARRIDDKWFLTAPVSTRAQESSVKEVLWDLEWAEKERTIEAAGISDELLREYGLDRPRGIVEVETVAGVKRFQIGGEAPGGENVYVRAGDDGPVHLVAADFADHLEKTVYEMRDKTVVDLAPGQVRTISIFGPEVKASLAKENGKWDLLEPFRDHANPESVNRFLENAAGLKVTSFVSDAPESYRQYGLPDPDSPHVVEQGRYISVGEGKGAGKQRIVHFGDPVEGKPEVYALVKGEPTVFTLPAESVEKLFIHVPELQAKKIVRMDPYAVKRATVSHELEQVEFAKRDFDWHIVKPFEAPADNKAVKDLLSTFEEAEMVEFVTAEADLERYGLDVASGSFSFVEGDARPQGVIFGAEAPEGGVYAKRTDTSCVFIVSKDLYEILTRSPLEYHTRQMQTISMDEAQAVTISRADGTFVIEPSGSGGGARDWRMREPVDAPTNPLVVSKIVLGLSTTTAEDLLERLPEDLAKYGLDEPAIEVAVKMPEGEEQPRRLLVGDACDAGGRFAMLEGGEMVFTIDKDFAAALGRELREAAVLDFPRSSATRVEFLADGGRFTVVKAEGEWKVEEPEGFSVTSAAVEDELVNLSRLETEKFVTYTTADLAEYGLLRPRAAVRIEAGEVVAALSVGDMHERGVYYATSTSVDGVFLLDPGDIINVLEPARLFEETGADAEDTGSP